MSEWVNPAPRTAVMWEVCFCSIYFWHGLVIQRKNLPDNGAQGCAGSLQNRAFSGSSFSVPANEGKCVDSDRKQHAGKWKVIGKSWLFVTFCYFKAFVSFLKCTFEKKKKWKEEKKKKTFLFFCFFYKPSAASWSREREEENTTGLTAHAVPAPHHVCLYLTFNDHECSLLGVVHCYVVFSGLLSILFIECRACAALHRGVKERSMIANSYSLGSTTWRVWVGACPHCLTQLPSYGHAKVCNHKII